MPIANLVRSVSCVVPKIMAAVLEIACTNELYEPSNVIS